MTVDRLKGDFRLTVAIAERCAEEKEWAEGYTFLVLGLRQAEHAERTDPAQIGELAPPYRRAIEEYVTRYGLRFAQRGSTGAADTRLRSVTDSSRREAEAMRRHARELRLRAQSLCRKSAALRHRSDELIGRAFGTLPADVHLP